MHKFEQIKAQFGQHASFAIWQDVGETPTSNVGDLSVFEEPLLTKNLTKLKSDKILLGLNISRNLITKPFSNFHDSRGNSKDYKLRYALRNTPLEGSYLTDVFKDIVEPASGKFNTYMRNNPSIEAAQILELRTELMHVSDNEHPTLIALGGDVFRYLKKHFDDRYPIFMLPHYAKRNSKEQYRSEVLEVISKMKS